MSNTQRVWADIYSHVLETVLREAIVPTEAYCLTLANRFLAEVCRDSPLPMTWSNDTGGELTISGVEVALPGDVLRVRRVEWDGSDNDIDKLDSLEEMDYEYPGWRDATGDPEAYVPVGQTLYLSAAPGTSAGKLYIRGSGYIPAFALAGDVIEDCEDAWTPGANVTAGIATGQVGTYCASLELAAAYASGTVGYEAIAAVNVATKLYTQAVLWLWSTVAIPDLSLALSFALDQHGAFASADESALPALALPADARKRIVVPLSTAQRAYTAAIGVGLVGTAVLGALGALTLHVDDVRLAVEGTNPLDYIGWGDQMLVADYILMRLPADPNNAFEMARQVNAAANYGRDYPQFLDSMRAKQHPDASY